MLYFPFQHTPTETITFFENLEVSMKTFDRNVLFSDAIDYHSVSMPGAIASGLGSIAGFVFDAVGIFVKLQSYNLQ
jgi:hypothetical protein